jgi:hypothetical protein
VKTAADAQAVADAYAKRVAIYRRLADENRRVATRLSAAVEKQAEIATQTKATVTVPLAAPAGGVDPAAIAPASVGAKRKAAAALADRLAAAAQNAADYQRRTAAALAAAPTAEVRQ